MPEYLAPAVYVEEVSFRAPSIEGVGTSTAAFVGPTRTGPLPSSTLGQTPELLTSFGDFANVYGGYENLDLAGTATNVNYLALSVKAFFDNGGARLYVQRVFTAKAADDKGVARSGVPGDDSVEISARFPGAALNRLDVQVTLIASKTQNVGALPTGTVLIELPEGGATPVFYLNGTGKKFKAVTAAAADLATPLPKDLYAVTMAVTLPTAAGGTAVFEGLGFDPAHPLFLGAVLGTTPPRRADALENQVAFQIGKNLTPSKLFTALFGDPKADLKVAPKIFTLANGNDGSEPVYADYVEALDTLQALENVAIVAAPGSSGYTAADKVVGALIEHVERPRAYRIAVLDTGAKKIASEVQEVRAKIDSTRAALYTPWVVMPNPLARPGTTAPDEIVVPPSGFVAGIYARNDQQRGVAKAPANEVVRDALRFERNINFAEQGLLNPLGINCLRYFPGRGYRVWGARTATSDSEFKYVNVRRYLNYLEHSIDNGSQWAVFENNGPVLWARVKESVEEFLYNEFANANLLGTSPSEAYIVRCDRSTMTQNDLDNGRLICRIGVALLKPAEFVVFRIGQKTADARS